jgi:hypothetical protein
MADYINIGGKQVLLCDLIEWLENRGLVAVPKYATFEMERSAETVDWPFPDIYGDLTSLQKQQGAADVWRAMMAAAPTPPIEQRAESELSRDNFKDGVSNAAAKSEE